MKTSHVLIFGDFNYPGIDWDTQTSVASVNEQEFLDYFRVSFLWQHVTQPTRFRGDQTANILELIMTNEERMIDDISCVDPIGKSDHLTT